jgi:hypothetical protein
MGIFLWIIKEIKEILIDESNGEKSVSADGEGETHVDFFVASVVELEGQKCF